MHEDEEQTEILTAMKDGFAAFFHPGESFPFAEIGVEEVTDEDGELVRRELVICVDDDEVLRMRCDAPLIYPALARALLLRIDPPFGITGPVAHQS